MNLAVARQVSYPDSDGKPIADNTLQFDWIAILKWGAEACFANDPNVFVAGDHLIYPAWIRNQDRLVPVPNVHGFVSPRLGFRFDLQKGKLTVFASDGHALRRPDQTEKELTAQTQRADREKQLAEKLAAMLRELGIDPGQP